MKISIAQKNKLWYATVEVDSSTVMVVATTLQEVVRLTLAILDIGMEVA